MRFKNAYPTRGRLVLALRAPAGPDGRAIRPRRRGPGDRAGAARARQRVGDRRAGARGERGSGWEIGELVLGPTVPQRQSNYGGSSPCPTTSPTATPRQAATTT